MIDGYEFCQCFILVFCVLAWNYFQYYRFHLAEIMKDFVNSVHNWQCTKDITSNFERTRYLLERNTKYL
jgi:hypothetical protein